FKLYAFFNSPEPESNSAPGPCRRHGDIIGSAGSFLLKFQHARVQIDDIVSRSLIPATKGKLLLDSGLLKLNVATIFGTTCQNGIGLMREGLGDGIWSSNYSGRK
ncbi:hypothetical protein PanWU01x14_036260, partial [Parasponia andersonii]